MQQKISLSFDSILNCDIAYFLKRRLALVHAFQALLCDHSYRGSQCSAAKSADLKVGGTTYAVKVYSTAPTPFVHRSHHHTPASSQSSTKGRVYM